MVELQKRSVNNKKIKQRIHIKGVTQQYGICDKNITQKTKGKISILRYNYLIKNNIYYRH